VSDLAEALLGPSPYRQYVYSYPHKTAYRPLAPPADLAAAWAAEDRSRLFLYWHIPFCEMRCGYCNLFSHNGAAAETVTAYLDTLERQARVMADLLAPCRVVRMAVGGGTPTVLAPAQLDRLFTLARQAFGVTAVPVSVETSPNTITAERLRVLCDHGVTRLSVGVESFVPEELAGLGRPGRASADAALELVRAAGFPQLNIDLIYGGTAQTAATWQVSLERAMAWRAEEVYLYPLYVRPLTGLHGRRSWDDHRRDAYRQGRDALLAGGYVQRSMRQFRRADAPEPDAPAYACQRDGMAGLGCGARSYAGPLHYSGDYAVRRDDVAAIVADYIGTPEDGFRRAAHGIRLTEADHARRWLLQSLLHADGFHPADYRAACGGEVLDDAPLLARLAEAGLVRLTAENIALTADGLEWSDAIGPALFDPRIQRLMDGFAWR